MATALQADRVVWSAQPGPQTVLLECPLKDAFYGGARGGGKTYALLLDFAQQAKRYGKHAKGILFRKTYPELEEVETQAYAVYGSVGATYNQTKRVWTFPNGATLRLRYLDTVPDAENYQGHSYTWQGFDEVGNWPTPEGIDKLWATLRSTTVPMSACVRRCTGNPGGPGHAWVKTRYIDAAPPLTSYRYQPMPDVRPDIWVDAIFIPARLEDNLLLDQREYESNLALSASGNETLYRAWREGDWDVFAGAAFPEWRDQLHIVPDRLPPRGWKYVAAMDWGYRQGSYGLYAIGPEGQVEKVWEYYQAFREKHARQAAVEIARASASLPRPEYIAADTQMWQEIGAAETLAEEFREGLNEAYGQHAPELIEMHHAPNSRRVKKNLMHRYLSWTKEPDGTVQPWQRPLLRFQQRCKHTIRTMKALPLHPTKPDDVDTTAEDHAYDETAFILASRPPLAEQRPEKIDQDNQHPGFDYEKRMAKSWTEQEPEPTGWRNPVSWSVPR